MSGRDHTPVESNAPLQAQVWPAQADGATPSEPFGHWPAVLDAMSDLVCLLSRDGTVVRCNRSMATFLGRDTDELAGKKCHELMHGSETFFEGCPYQEMLRTARRESFELPLGSIWYQVTADPAYVDKLFSPFQRLHAAHEFPGTGVGLAAVARVLEQLGGSWWADGEVGAGATFCFALPDARSGSDGGPTAGPPAG